MEKYNNVTEAVWVAAAMMTYNEYFRCIREQRLTKDCLYFKQGEIQKFAQEICTNDVHNARISQWFNGNHPESNHNFLSAQGSLRRLAYRNEFSGIKEVPDTIDYSNIVDTINGEKTVGEILDFINNEYTKFMEQETKDDGASWIRFRYVLDFLEKNASKPYQKPENIADENYKQEILQIREEAKQAIIEFKAIGEYFKNKGFTFDNNTASAWLDGSNTKIRKYFWIELKKPNKTTYPTSISIFAEKENEEVRFRVTLEIKDSISSEADYKRHNQFLDIFNPEKEEFEYFSSRKDGLNLHLVKSSDINTIIQKTKAREHHKLQIGRSISYDEISNSTCKDILTLMEDTIRRLEPYYNKAVDEGEGKMISLKMSLDEFKEVIKIDSNCIRKIKSFRKGKESLTDWMICCIFGTVRISVNPYPHLISEKKKEIETTVRQNVSRYFQAIGYDASGRKITSEMEEFMSKASTTTTLYEAVKLLKEEMVKANKSTDEIDEFIKVLVEGLEEESMKIQNDNLTDKILNEKNIILYGPPGTGKTYNTIKYAVAIIENKSIEKIEAEVKEHGYEEILNRYREYKSQEQITFTTFHQSYGYEEFIEGIKPVINEDINGEIRYDIEDGIFKKFCDGASNFKVMAIDDEEIEFNNPTIWKISLEGAGENQTKRECFNEGHIRIGWDKLPKTIEYDTDCDTNVIRDILIDFQDNLSIGDIVLSLRSKDTIDAIGVVIGDYEYDHNLSNYRRKRKVRWLAYDINENILSLNGNIQLTQRTLYKLNRISINDLIPMINKYRPESSLDMEQEDKNYVFIIDEINRGNISKIFGELITLIEKQKRLGADEELKVRLPYSNKDFGVPNNVYILGTMNTADRSIALLDTALRRRFKFIETMPDSSVLDGINVEGVDISRLLDMINKRIEILYDREHTIGHAYFMELTSESKLDELANIFRNAIIPLLQEYFYEDYKKIQLVLGDVNKQEEFKFILDNKVDTKIFGSISDIDIDHIEVTFKINESAFNKAEAYMQVYEV